MTSASLEGAWVGTSNGTDYVYVLHPGGYMEAFMIGERAPKWAGSWLWHGGRLHAQEYALCDTWRRPYLWSVVVGPGMRLSGQEGMLAPSAMRRQEAPGR